MVGSSPLARGLPTPLWRGQAARRIIPARAGFTADQGRVPAAARDHPRSRGVYSSSAASGTSSGGSSPLARGLRIGDQDVRGEPRIIPARAGFTIRPRNRAQSFEDHPRSRGVYGVWDIDLDLKEGSSPLARGLPLTGSESGPAAGIIPARAGFTADAAAGHVAAEDHPRSRGVYGEFVISMLGSAGSSPLARGLHPHQPASPPARRIIPARAGFTSPSRGCSAEFSDHPRSRGVYIVGGPDGSLEGGSSPLARGLHPVIAAGRVDVRIIPARAGFTRKERP